MTAVNSARRVEGPSKDRPAQQLVDAGFAWEIADAPLLHHGLNMADIAHVLDLRHRRISPDRAAAALLGVLLDTHRTKPEDFLRSSAGRFWSS